MILTASVATGVSKVDEKFNPDPPPGNILARFPPMTASASSALSAAPQFPTISLARSYPHCSSTYGKSDPHPVALGPSARSKSPRSCGPVDRTAALAFRRDAELRARLDTDLRELRQA